MKIAIPTRADQVDDHFGHCEAYSVFTITDDNNVASTELLPSPQGCGCKSNIASVLQQHGVTVMLAGSMGNGALNVLTNHGIKVYRGCTGNINEVVKEYLEGKITDSGEGCREHADDHQCSHH